ncbi:MAG: hypothetical protein GY881_15360, partial [Gammaproteobacteria bacterium]|nr:hypothetical protein [Gammaproteobacteria bacterium]
EVDGETFNKDRIDSFTGRGQLKHNAQAVNANDVGDVSTFTLFTYQPLNNDVSGGSFPFTVIDSSNAESQVANTITLAMTATEDTPTSADTAQTTLEDTNHVFAQSQFPFADNDLGDTFDNLLVVNTVTNGQLTLNNTPVTDNQTIAFSDLANLAYVPVADDVLGSSFTFQVQDNNGSISTDTYTFTLSIAAQADAPTAADGNISIDEDVAHSFTVSDFDFADVDGETLFKIVIKAFNGQGSLLLDNNPLSPDQEISVADIGKLTYQTASHDINTSTIDYRVIDTSNQESIQNTVLTVNINPIADNPTAADKRITVTEDNTYTLSAADFGFVDVDGDSFTQIRVGAWSGNGVLAFNNIAVSVGQLIDVANLSQLIYTPTLNDINDGLFTFTVRDSSNAESISSQLITLAITPVDDMPTSADNSLALVEDTPHTFVANEFAFTDVDGDSFKDVQIVTLPSDGSLSLAGGQVSNNALIAVSDIGNLVYTPKQDDEVGSSFTFKVIDSADNVSVSSYTFTFNITPQNDTPTAADNAVALAEDSQHRFSASEFNFADVDAGNSLQSVEIITNVNVGQLELNGNPVAAGDSIAVSDLANLVYVAQADDMLGSSFSFAVIDNTSLQSLLNYTMTLNINALSDAPTASGMQVAVVEDTPRAFAQSDFGFGDVDGDTFKELIVVSTTG